MKRTLEDDIVEALHEIISINSDTESVEEPIVEGISLLVNLTLCSLNRY